MAISRGCRGCGVILAARLAAEIRGVIQCGVDAAARDEFGAAPSSTTPPLPRTTIFSTPWMVAMRWVMMSVVRPRISSSIVCHDRGFGGRIERAGRLVEDEDGRVLQKGAGDADALALADAEVAAAFADLASGSRRACAMMKSWACARFAASMISSSVASGRP